MITDQDKCTSVCPVLYQGFLGQSFKYDKKIHRYIEQVNKNYKAQPQVNIIAQRNGFDNERDFLTFLYYYWILSIQTVLRCTSYWVFIY